ncbi:MAG: hypothetical protein LBE56_13400 [Tannerella sp.]|nr:hypothetical protein [Tannerella sp.]
MKRITFLIASVLLLMACNNEIDTDLNLPEIPDSQITLKLPDAQVFTYSTATVSECTIDEIWVLEFNGNTLDTAVLINGANIAYNGQATQMLPQLPFEVENGHKIILIANSGRTTFPAGIDTTTINTFFPLSASSPNVRDYYLEGEHLPMYGKIDSWPGTTAYSCEMIRAVAKIQVRLGETFTDLTGSNVWPNGVYYNFWNHAVEGQIQPSATVTGIPSSSVHLIPEHLRLLQFDANTSDPKMVYVYEYNSSMRDNLGNSVSPTVFDVERPYLLFTDGTVYWRLDFYDAYATSPTYKQFVDVKRSSHYIFTINRVSSPGYNLDFEAINNPGSNIEYTVEVKDGSSHITSNGQYAIVSSVDSAYVAAGASGVTIATVRYQLPAEMTGLGAGTVNTMNTDATPSGSMTVTSPSPTATLTATDAPIIVTTTSTFTEGTITFQLGNITHKIGVKKQP